MRRKGKTHSEMLKMALELTVMYNIEEINFRGKKINLKQAKELLKEMEN